jgi:1-acyl-sn-glycerol-3-phosphate acyltransferase
MPRQMDPRRTAGDGSEEAIRRINWDMEPYHPRFQEGHPMPAEPLPRITPPTHHLAARLLALVASMAVETRPGLAAEPRLDSSLDRDLGLDSLARVELLGRVERELGVRLPEDTLERVDTPGDLLHIIAGLAARPTSGAAQRAPERAAPPGRIATRPDTAATLVDVLEWHAAAHPAREHILFYRSSDETDSLSYGQLLRNARAVAAGLAQGSLRPGQAVAIMLPSGLDFFAAFYGALLAGGVPVPLYPPARLSQLEEHLRQQVGILANCQAPVLVTVAEARLAGQLLRAQVDSLRRVCTVAELRTGSASPPPALALGPTDVALLQYTSGSTGNPKGVVLTHANLLANIRAVSRTLAVTSADVCVSWLPLYHDMGLIGAWLGSLYNACPLVLMSPLTFLARPELWLQAIHRHRGTITAAPNFAFELCLRRLGDEDLAGLDLSTWRLALNGAEAVSPATIEAFCARLAPCGFRPSAMKPVYGLAECSVALTIPAPGEAPRIERVVREAFAAAGKAVPAAPEEAGALGFVACGPVLPGHELRVVDAAGRELPERRVGRVQFRGPSATAGYFRNPEETRRLFHGAWLDTGDLAYLAEGRLFPVGRVKDVIVIRGRNLHPAALEEAIGRLPGLRKGCVAVFGAADPVAGTERVVAVAETHLDDAAARKDLTHQINALAVDLLGQPLDDIVLAPPHSVQKTSSGKIRRSATRERYLAGALGQTGSAAWQQFARLFRAAIGAQLRRWWRRAGEELYAAYVWTLLILMATPVWLVVATLRRPSPSWALCHRAARLFLRLAGLPLAVTGEPPQGPCVVIANHASYLDGLLLVAALRRPLAFVAKRELGEQFVAGYFLRGLGAEFVERFEVARSVDDARRLTALARSGKTLAFFPEGTFTRAAGLRPFYMGAFLAAADSRLPLVPVAIRGSRAVLRDGGWFPRRGAIAVTIDQPLQPQGSGWDAARALRDQARAEILRHCGEHDLLEQDSAILGP